MTMTTVLSRRYMIYLQYPPQKGICSLHYPLRTTTCSVNLK